MSFLCSCTRKPRLDEDSFEYCYGYHRKLSEGAAHPEAAPTPRVKRKFPEGVGPPLPLVPSDLEDYVDKKSTEDQKPYPLPEIKLTPANDDKTSVKDTSSESDIDEVERTLLSICEQEEAKLYGDRISHCSSTNARRDASSTDRDISSSSSITTASSLNLIQYDEDTDDDDSSSDMFWENDRDDTRSITSQELEDLLIGNGEEDDEESLLEWDRMYVEEENEMLHQHSKPVIIKEWLKGELVNTHDIPEERKLLGDDRNAAAKEESSTGKSGVSEKESTKEGIILVLDDTMANKDRTPTDGITDLSRENTTQQKTSEIVPECTLEKVVTSSDQTGIDAAKTKRRSSKRKDSSKRKKDGKVAEKCPSEAPSTSSEDSVRELKMGRFKVTTVSPQNHALDLAQNSNVQDAFVIAVEQQARERLERLSALKRIKPVDMTKLSQQELLDSSAVSK